MRGIKKDGLLTLELIRPRVPCYLVFDLYVEIYRKIKKYCNGHSCSGSNAYRQVPRRGQSSPHSVETGIFVLR